MTDSSFPETSAERHRLDTDWSFLRPVREETVEIAKTGRYGEGARKVEAYLRAHPGWNRAWDIMQATRQMNLTARISEAKAHGVPIEWSGTPRDSMYRLKEER